MQIAIMPGTKENYSEYDITAALKRILEVEWAVYKALKECKYLITYLRRLISPSTKKMPIL
jgi:hypothetical protein